MLRSCRLSDGLIATAMLSFPDLHRLPGAGIEVLRPLLKAQEIRREHCELLILLDHCQRILRPIEMHIRVSQSVERKRILRTQPVRAAEIFQRIVVTTK